MTSPTTEELAITLSLRNIIAPGRDDLRLYVYDARIDKTKGEPELTGGYGRKLTREDVRVGWALGDRVSRRQAGTWLVWDHNDACRAAIRVFAPAELESADSVRWAAIIDLCYWMGEEGLRDGFPRFCAAFREQNWKQAGLELCVKRPELIAGANQGWGYYLISWATRRVNSGGPSDLYADAPTRTRAIADRIATGRETCLNLPDLSSCVNNANPTAVSRGRRIKINHRVM